MTLGGGGGGGEQPHRRAPQSSALPFGPRAAVSAARGSQPPPPAGLRAQRWGGVTPRGHRRATAAPRGGSESNGAQRGVSPSLHPPHPPRSASPAAAKDSPSCRAVGMRGRSGVGGGSRPVPSASLKRGDAFNGPERFRSAHCAAFGRRRAEGFGRHPPAQTPIPPPTPPWALERIGSLCFPSRCRIAAPLSAPNPGHPARRCVPCRGVGGGAVRGSVAVLGPPGTAPPPSPMSHTVRRGGCPLCEDGRWAGEGARQPYRPHCVCVGQSRMGGMEGGGGTWGSQPQRGRGARARGLPLMSAARINNRRAAGTNGSSVPDPPGAPALLGQSPPPFIPPLPFLPPALSVGWAADCRPGGVGSGCGMRDAGCGRRGAAHRAAEQSQRRADAPPSLQVPPPDFPPPGWVPPVPPPWRRCRPSPQRSQALCPPVPRCWHAVSCPPPPHSAAPGAAPGPPPLPPQGQHPSGSGRAVPTLCHAAGSADGRRVGGGRHCPPPHPDPGCTPTAAVWVCITPKPPLWS